MSLTTGRYIFDVFGFMREDTPIAHGISGIFPTEASTPQIDSTLFSKIIQAPCEELSKSV